MNYLRNSKPRTKTTRSNDTETGTPPKKPRKEFEQFPQSPAVPSPPEGEDEASMLGHIKQLQLEEKKMAPNRVIVDDLMAKIFSYWCQELLQWSNQSKKIYRNTHH